MSRIQGPVNALAAANNVTASFPNTPTQGNLLIAWGKNTEGTDGGAISGWTKAVEARWGAASGYISLFYKIAGASESKDVNYSRSGATETTLTIEEHSDIDTLDKTSSANSTSGVTSKSTGSTPTTTQANEVAFAGFAHGANVTGISYSNSFVSEFGYPTGNIQFHGASKVLTSTGAQETTASWTNSRFCGAIIATFYKAAASIVIPVFMNQYKQRWSS